MIRKPASSVVITGLSNEDEYMFIVRSKNAIGFSTAWTGSSGWMTVGP